MTNILILFLILLALLAVLVIAGVVWNKKPENFDIDSQYLDENGDHVYYDRNLIEKREYLKRHPDAKGVRTLGRLFARKKKR